MQANIAILDKKKGEKMTDLEIRILSNLVEALPLLNENAKYRLLGYGEGLTDKRENDKNNDKHRKEEK